MNTREYYAVVRGIIIQNFAVLHIATGTTLATTPKLSVFGLRVISRKISIIKYTILA
jgi:hypothetical protein